MKLYWFWSFNPQKPRLALEELGEPYELIKVDLVAREQRSPEFLALNPRGQVPVLDDEGFVLTQSLAIIAYLGDKYQRFWPDSPQERASAIEWLMFLASAVEDSVGTIWFNRRMKPRMKAEPNHDAVTAAIQRLKRPMKFIDATLSGRDYLMGDFTLVDCAAGPLLAALDTASYNFDEYPAVRAYLQCLKARDAWKKAKVELAF